MRPSAIGSITASTRSSAATMSLKAWIAMVLSSSASGFDDPAVPEHVVDEHHAVGAQPRQELLVVARGSRACRRR